MPYYRKDNRDANHAEIVDALRKHGYEVIETERPLDCLVFDGSNAGWIEIKTKARNAPIKTSQIAFMAHTKMPVAFVKTVDAALAFVGDSRLYGLTRRQKDNLAVFLLDADKKQYHPAVIERVLNW